MKEIKSPFFGESGLTKTSANHIANLAKESYLSIEKDINSISFINKTVELIGTDKVNVLSSGRVNIDDIESKLMTVAKYKSLIAWLREAIKEKTLLENQAERLGYEDFDIKIPEMPVEEKTITQEEVINSWEIKKRNRYLFIETVCSQLGKYIHQDGYYSDARENMYNIINAPSSVGGSGRDTMIYHYEPSIEPEKVDELYMELQNKYREFQAELNGMKHEIEVAVDNDRKEKMLKYDKDLQDYRDQMKVCSSELMLKKAEYIEKVKGLKIVIPDSLRDVYDIVNSLGK